MYLQLEDNSAIELIPIVPGNYTGHVISGTTLLSASAHSFQMVVQEIGTTRFTLRYCWVNVTEKTMFSQQVRLKTLKSVAILTKPIHLVLNEGDVTEILKDQFIVYKTHQAKTLYRFDAPGIYIFIEIYYTAEMLKQLYGVCPAIKSMAELPNLYSRPTFITCDMQSLILEISRCSYDDTVSKLFFDIKAQEYLLRALTQFFRKTVSLHSFSRFDTERLLQAREILLNDITRKPYTIAELAKTVGVNEFKLKNGFRHLFGKGVFECLHEKRMDKARELLLTTEKPIKEICTLTGYPRITNFITAFRRTFGYTPGSLRRK